MSPQIAVRVSPELASALDGLVSEGRFETKADAIRAAIEALVDVDRRRKIGEAIVEGYRRIPPGDDLDLEAELDRATHEMLADLAEEEGDRPW
jgi:Arc/MetJ-type ribon-helix-helix transcriptional regulator